LFNHPQINVVALQIGPLKIHWYAISYLLGFAFAWWIAKIRAAKLNYHWDNEIISDLIFYCALGVIVGGRLGYVLFYGLTELFSDPWFIFKIWHGGMSFHGGLLGVVIGLFFFARKMNLSWIEMLDFASVLTPIGLGLGRIGNFINSEVWGRITTVPWAVIFPNGGPLPRHPSQLYEALGEGLLLFTIVWFYNTKKSPKGLTISLFLICYGLIRFGLEFFREPDAHLGFIAMNWLTMGQLLSLPMLLIGGLLWWFYRPNRKP
jgi:phosphatidylglycerol---prolipoprotein diacylglyceryl transferase